MVHTVKLERNAKEISLLHHRSGVTPSDSQETGARLLTFGGGSGKSHRRPVDCLDVDGGRVMSGGRLIILHLASKEDRY